MQSRFLVHEAIVEGQRIELQGDELHHAVRVLRVRPGESIELFDGRGHGAAAFVVEVTKNRVEVEIGAPVPSRESPLHLVLAAALIAPDKYELVLQKGCELGVSRFVPVVTDRVETRVERIQGKTERWERILLEATKQCGRTVLPVLDLPRAFGEVLAVERCPVVFDADAEPGPWPRPEEQTLTLLIGPEGGLTPGEINQARDAGAAVCSLGPRRLRAETAAIAAMTLAGSHMGDLMPHPRSAL